MSMHGSVEAVRSLAMGDRRFTLGPPVDIAATAGALRNGLGDPTTIVTARELWRATLTPDGPATLHITADGDGFVARAWGPGADRLLADAPGLLGAHDDDRGFTPVHRAVALGQRRQSGMRIGRGGGVVHALVPAVLAQRVTSGEAVRAWRRLCGALGEPAPGPRPLRLPPQPARLAELPYWWYHRLGVERRRADTIRRVGRLACHLEGCIALPWTEAGRRLLGVDGVGPWTAAVVADAILGDPDAVPVGDFHLPHVVTHALTGAPRGDDATMLELLAPYGDQRGRALRFIVASGIRAPRFGPRRALVPIASY